MILHDATLAVDRRATLGEGPIWDDARQRLLWVDLTSCQLHAYHPGDGVSEIKQFSEPVCAVAPLEDGALLVAFAKRIARVDWNTQKVETVCVVEPDKPGNRCNDGKRDPAGRFWIGTMSQSGKEPGVGVLYRLDNGILSKVLDNLTIANGMGWTADRRTMFYIDSPTREVWAFDFDETTSTISNRRTAVVVPDNLGVPDGMCVGPDDTIWVAHWGAGCVCRWDPASGELLQRVNTGCPHTSSCALAPDGTLYITTARTGLSAAALAQAPVSGGLFAFPTGEAKRS